MLAQAASLFFLLDSATSHMILNTPYPYNYQHSTPLVQVSPLGNLPFPCQGLSTIEQTTTLTAGSTQFVNFTGGAQHGGGSCAFSMTYEYPPPADKSKWKTIYTLIGGCPVSAVGNLPAAAPDAQGRADSPHCGNDSGVECVRQFEVPIPKDMPSGNATFAWTWYNAMGNRELYMSCAPVQVAGGSEDTTFFDTLPEIFVANIPGECVTAEGILNIPNPGQYGRVLQEPTAGAEGNCPKVDGVPVFEDDGPTSPDPSVSISTSTSTSPAKVSSTSVVAVPSGFTTVTTSKASSASPPASTMASAPPANTGSPSGGSETALDGCADGAVVCLTPGFFGICDGEQVVPQPLAAGTACRDGAIGYAK
ncbi:hypothetical protein B0T17DRAFT_486914 [Bombardia bombarda]|uniref:Lytic polysaccharide monooxygenase n=1 Tax=Bombardia bombarda TaxID=252184 RepID=A0AA40C9N7_9PEZI|nr:hypothetical protein B0T17DRAFT_486914 [Bombardia bombarda]